MWGDKKKMKDNIPQEQIKKMSYIERKYRKMGNCKHNERHSWVWEFGDQKIIGNKAVTINKKTCVKCGEINHITHRVHINKK